MSPKRLRVAVLSRAVFPLHGYGGLERHVYDLVRHLDARDVEVTLISRPPDAAAAAPDLPATYQPIPYRTFPLAGRRGTTVLDRDTAYPVFGYRAGRFAATLARRGLIDLVHGLGAAAFGYALARTRARDRTVPLVLNPQGLEEFGATGAGFARAKRWAYLPLQIVVRRTAQAADRVLATDRVLEPIVRDHLHLPAGRIRLVPNAIDVARCRALAGPAEGRQRRQALGLGGDTMLLLSVGRLEHNKGYQTLVDALGQLGIGPSGATADPLPPWRWVLIGEGPLRATLARAIERSPARDRITLVGSIPDADVHAWYEAADLFVHPTLYEGSSLVSLEAMAHGKPVVASAAGGLPDKVLPGRTGWLVQPGDAEELARTLATAIRDADRLVRFGREGRALVEREFGWPAVVDRLVAVYRELVKW